MRTASAITVAVVALAGMILLLMRGDPQPWQLAPVGAVAGAVAGGVRWGRVGALVGGAFGSVLGLIAPLLYIPFWLAFTLPPHPEYDL
jgi:H+/gluconate symporter-like permease